MTGGGDVVARRQIVSDGRTSACPVLGERDAEIIGGGVWSGGDV